MSKPDTPEERPSSPCSFARSGLIFAGGRTKILRPQMLRFLPRPVWTATWLLGGALVAWIVTVSRMRGMDGGPGTDLGGLGWYVGIWVTMMGAMMLPSVFPMVLLFGRVSSEGGRRGEPVVPTWVFVMPTSPSGRCTGSPPTVSTESSELSISASSPGTGRGPTSSAALLQQRASTS